MRRGPGKIFPVTLKQLLSRPATVAYPAGAEKQFPAVRGMITFNAELCIGCTACVRDCPSKAIEIEKIADEPKQFNAIINKARCVFCGQCVDSCPKDALKHTPNFELAALSRDGLISDTWEW